MQKADAHGVTFAGILTAIVVAVVPFVVSRHLFYGAVNAKYFFVIGALSIAFLYAAYLFFTRREQIYFRGRWLLGSVGLLLVIHYVAAFSGVYPALSLWSDIIRSTGVFFVTYIAFFAWWASELLSERDWRLVRRTIALFAGVFALLSSFGPEGLGVSGRLFTVNFEISGLSLGNPTFAGAYLVLAFIITLIELFRTPKESSLRWWLSGAAMLQFFSPILLGSAVWRGSIRFGELFSNSTLLLGSARASSVVVMMIILYLGGWMLLKRLSSDTTKKYLIGGWSGVWALGVLSLVTLLFVPGSFIQERYIEESTAARVIVWNEGWEAFQERPVLGWGPETFRFAHEAQFDNELYLPQNIGEIWFDRAHNVVVDTLVGVGLVGSLAFILLAGFFLWRVKQAQGRELIGGAEAQLLGVFVFAHFLQLQTSFDTVGTYVLSALLLGYVLSLERRVQEAVEGKGESNQRRVPYGVYQTIAGVVVVLVLVGSGFLLFAEYSRQRALVDLFARQGRESQIQFIDQATARGSSFESLRIASSSLIKGLLEGLSEVPAGEREDFILSAREQMNIYSEKYEDYLEAMPHDYRTRMNYAYLLLVQSAFGENRVEEAETIIEDSYVLSPENPLTFVLHALAELYSGNVAAAKEKIHEAVALNPEVPFSQNVGEYIEEQEKQFPTITILKLENL